MKISVKASNVATMIDAYRLLADTVDYPLHLGVTEAGPPPAGLVKSTAGIGTLLAEGIGDTIRYSLTADPVEEARAGRTLLESLGLRERKGLDLIACPSCGRAEVDVIKVANDAHGRARRPPDPAAGRGDGLRRQRSRRGARRRPRHRRRPSAAVTSSSRARSCASSPRTRWSRRSWPRPSGSWRRASTRCSPSADAGAEAAAAADRAELLVRAGHRREPRRPMKIDRIRGIATPESR